VALVVECSLAVEMSGAVHVEGVALTVANQVAVGIQRKV
jgi:hypothetical protein